MRASHPLRGLTERRRFVRVLDSNKRLPEGGGAGPGRGLPSPAFYPADLRARGLGGLVQRSSGSAPPGAAASAPLAHVRVGATQTCALREGDQWRLSSEPGDSEDSHSAAAAAEPSPRPQVSCCWRSRSQLPLLHVTSVTRILCIQGRATTGNEHEAWGLAQHIFLVVMIIIIMISSSSSSSVTALW